MRNAWATVSMAAVVLSVSACNSIPTDSPLETSAVSAPAGTSSFTRRGFEQARAPAMLLSNLDLCALVTYPTRGGPASHRTFRVHSPPPTTPFPGEPALGLLQVFAMRTDNKTTVLNGACVVPTTGRSPSALRGQLLRDLRAELRIGGSIAEGGLLAVGSSGANAGGFTGNVIWCSWIHEDVDMVCTGFVTCTVAAELRAVRQGGGTADVVFGCNNGCALDPAVGFLCSDHGGGASSGEVGPIEDPPVGEGGSGSAGSPNTFGDDDPRVVSDTLFAPHLRHPSHDERDQILSWINRLPEWAKTTLSAIVNDTLSLPRRFRVYDTKIPHPTGDGWVPMAVRRAGVPYVHSFFWVYMGEGWVNEHLMSSLCEEAAHLHYGLRDGDPQLTVRIAECLSGIQT